MMLEFSTARGLFHGLLTMVKTLVTLQDVEGLQVLETEWGFENGPGSGPVKFEVFF